MKKVCAWCKADLGETPSDVHPPDAITHGICETCRRALVHPNRETLLSFLERLKVPLLLLDKNACVLSVNGTARLLLGKTLEEIENHLAGEVIECAHAREPGGCGKTIHCRSCTIRRTVTDTYTSGASHVRVPAYQDILTPWDVKQVRFLISTERVGGRVLLRIDERAEGGSPALPA
jgi:hypothetical protein